MGCWICPHEFFGYLVRVLEAKIAEDGSLHGGYTDQESHWLRYVAALMADRNHDKTRVETLLQPVVLATGRENWLYFLALAWLEKTQRYKLARIENSEVRRQYQAQLDQYAQKFEKSRPQLAERQALLAPLQAKLGRETEESLAEKAGESPEYVLTGRLALAFWAEGNGDKNKAIDHYREALGSYMDDMIEYVFAVERIKTLRQKSQ